MTIAVLPAVQLGVIRTSSSNSKLFNRSSIFLPKRDGYLEF